MDKISMITLLLARAYTDKKTSEVPAVIQYKGVTTTALSDGATTNPITINGSSYTAVNGDTVFYDGVAYTFDGTVWQETISLAQIITELEGLDEKIGDLTDLTTTDKDSVVDAINELVTAVGGKQDTLTFDDTPTDNSNNPVKSNGVYDALALKQDKTDNTLQTTDKTVVGAVNELKSGLTNYENQNNTNLEVANRKNILPVSLANVKAKNTTGTWTGNTYAINRGEITFTANADGYITEIVINGTFATRTTFFKLCDNFSPFETKNYILSGVVADTEQEVIQIYFHNDTDDIDVNPRDKGQGATISLNKGKSYTCYLRVSTGTRIDNNSAYPMLRETWQNATFAPYIPSVESRIEAVESGLNSISDGVAITGLILEQGVNGVIDDAKVFRFGKLIVGNIRITLNDTLAESYPLIHGLPKMNTTLAAFSGLCPVVTNKPSVVCVIFNESVVDQASLSLANGVSSEAGVLMISFSYVSV